MNYRLEAVIHNYLDLQFIEEYSKISRGHWREVQSKLTVSSLTSRLAPPALEPLKINYYSNLDNMSDAVRSSTILAIEWPIIYN